MSPSIILCDYELPLRESLRSVFLQTVVMGDSFHFMQANHRKMKKLLKEPADTAPEETKREWTKTTQQILRDLTETLRVLWASTNVTAFQSNLQWFCDYWSVSQPTFVSYFECTWIDIIKPVEWVFYGCDISYPTGDQMLEGWHNRLHKYVIPSPDQAIDFLVEILSKEMKYYEHILQTPHQLKEILKDLEDNKRRNDRRHQILTDYVGKQKSTHSV